MEHGRFAHDGAQSGQRGLLEHGKAMGYLEMNDVRGKLGNFLAKRSSKSHAFTEKGRTARALHVAATLHSGLVEIADVDGGPRG
jgi:hypothetical protein